ncbi:leucine-rich repeat, immunoglobulin-like domain-containing kekkon 3 protein [Haematobia irritans]|uniref:leucine-rich repeat, immunoglobulin-like domain-containing kekkon 3 protein n=1 Tax=Haematobia irritans TaxID=7368 RepID=UPI003F501C01
MARNKTIEAPKSAKKPRIANADAAALSMSSMPAKAFHPQHSPPQYLYQYQRQHQHQQHHQRSHLHPDTIDPHHRHYCQGDQYDQHGEERDHNHHHHHQHPHSALPHSSPVLDPNRRTEYCIRDDNTAKSITLSFKVRRKSKLYSQSSATTAAAAIPLYDSLKSFRSIPLVQLLWLLCCLSQLVHRTMAECPSVCECKWKSGKESVLCLNANLTHIPAPLDAGTQALDLTGNELASIPDDTFAEVNLLNLQKVYLAKCRLRLIERYAFRGLINLVELDLSYNALVHIPSDALASVTELRELKLNGNPILVVANDAFKQMMHLVRLELSDCRIEMVEVKAFAGLESSLEYLKLDGNKLSEVRSGTITSLTNLHGISLSRNMWNCSCSLRPLRAWMLRENIPCGIPPVCQNPPRLTGKSWDKIDLDDFACVPQIIATDTTAHGVEGRNVTMSCYVEGVPEPSVRWMVKNRVIANLTATNGEQPSTSPRTAAATQGRKTYVVNMLRNASNLTILTADMQDAGIYTCAAENKAGKVEASVTLAVSRRPPEAPLGFKVILLCIFIALLFVAGSSFGAICLCSLRRKRKMRLWNTVPQGRTESYEKIEMTSRIAGAGGANKPDLGGKTTMGIQETSNKNGNGGGGGNTQGQIFHDNENGYLCSATTPLNCGSDDGGDTGGAIVNPSGGSSKRNGDYRNIPTHCDDDDNEHMQQSLGSVGGGIGHTYQRSLLLASSGHNNGTLATTTSTSLTTPRWKTSSAFQSAGGPDCHVSHLDSPQNALKSGTKEDTDLHIPRLIDIGSTGDTASGSISGKVDAASRQASTGYNHVANWVTSSLSSTKVPHSSMAMNNNNNNNNHQPSSMDYYSPKDEVNSSVFYAKETSDNDLFDSNYPDLLDIAKYAVAQATSASQTNGGLCTLPRKLKNTGKYFKNSSDSQSPLLADNSSKYGSSTLGDAGYLNEVALGRRFSAESSYSGYGGPPTYSKGQRSNSFLNLVHSSSKNTIGTNVGNKAAIANVGARRNPSLPSSPVHDYQQQHQRSLSSAATPLLDFSSLTNRTGLTNAPAGTPSGMSTSMHCATSNTPVTAYDYHAAQLERFLEEYRNLQDQLCKMKETCDTIRKKEVPLRVSLGQSAHAADPVMYNAALAAAHSPTTNPKMTLKTKASLPGQPPDPPPYWLHRNAMLKRLNEPQNDIFKS